MHFIQYSRTKEGHLNLKKMKLLPQEIRDQLRERFPQSSLSKMPGAAKLTSIKIMYVIERLNNVFGVGEWVLEWGEHQFSNQDEIIIQGFIKIPKYDFQTPATFGSARQTFYKGTETPIQSIGDLGKSAVSALISKSASFLEVGIDVFKGLQTHETPDAPETKWYPIPDDKDVIEVLEGGKWDEKLLGDNGAKITGKNNEDVYLVFTDEQVITIKEHLDKKHLEELDKKEVKK